MTCTSVSLSNTLSFHPPSATWWCERCFVVGGRAESCKAGLALSSTTRRHHARCPHLSSNRRSERRAVLVQPRESVRARVRIYGMPRAAKTATDLLTRRFTSVLGPVGERAPIPGLQAVGFVRSDRMRNLRPCDAAWRWSCCNEPGGRP